MAGINKNFKVQNGLEVATNLLVVDAITKKVGIGTTVVGYKLHVNGGIGVTHAYVSGILTSTALNATTLSATTLNATTLSADTAYIRSGVVTSLASSSATITNIVGTSATITGTLRVGTGGTAIATTSGNSVGIGSTIPTSKLTVSGDVSVTGVITARTFSGQINSGLGTITNLNATNINAIGIVTAFKYYGDGSSLTNVSNGVGINTAGGLVGAGATILDFRGSGISTVTVSAGIATINISGGSVSIAVTNVTPPSPAQGNLWYNTNLGRTFIYYSDGSSSQWVDAAPFNVGIITTLGFISGSASSPSVYFVGDAQTGLFSPSVGRFGISASGIERFQINPSGVFISGICTATTFIGNLTGTASNATSATSATTAATATYATSAGIGSTTTRIPYLTGPVTSSGANGTATAIASGVIVDANISASAAIAVSKLAASTISSISLGSNLATLTKGSYLTGSNYNGSTATTWAVDADTASTGNKIVVRDGSGDFSANIITCVDLNSTSDVNLKEDIRPVDDALERVNQLEGVNFTWKKDQRKSIGVIAQELEQIFPELVTEVNSTKTVNYNGLIGVLIEAVKELSAEVEKLKNQPTK